MDQRIRKFKILPRVEEITFEIIQREFENEIPKLLKVYLREFAGLSIEESIFVDKNGLEWELHCFQNNIELMKMPKEFKDANWGLWIPFAYDPGGWHFCLCMNVDNYNSVYINRWTDNKPEEQFLKIADSFEIFIEGLKANE